MWKIITGASTAVLLLGTAASADLVAWDSTADSVLDETEFGAGFGQGDSFDIWDSDGDGLLSENEWGVGLENQIGAEYNEDDWGLFSDWDENEDALLDEAEFNSGVFGAYDLDDDDLWGDEEYGAWQDDGWF